MPVPIAVRLRIFLERLATAAPVATHDDAWLLIADALNTVENKYSGIPFDPQNWNREPRRMYPFQKDKARPSSEFPGVIAYRSFKHRSLIAPNGAYVIVHVETERVEIDRPGADGRRVSDFAAKGHTI